MPPLPPGPPAGPDIRASMTFRTFRKGREAKLGRPLNDAELLELERFAAASQARGVSPASQRSVLETAKAAVAALPKVLPGVLIPQQQLKLPTFRGPRDLSRSTRTRAGRAVEDVGVLIRMAIKDGRRGPHLPVRGRRNSALYVQQDDLDTFIPDGWGQLFKAEAGVLGRSMGLPPRVVPLLCLLQWSSSFRAPSERDRHQCGSGLQVSLDWLARKLGCSRVWVQALINKLDPFASWRRECLETQRSNRRRAKRGVELLPPPQKPRGTAYVHRFRRLERFEEVKAADDQRRIWIDADGRPHVYVDVRGVLYITAAGRRLLGRARTGVDAEQDVNRRGNRSRWLLSARLRRGHSFFSGRNVGRVLENRRELLAAPGVPRNLSPNNSPPRGSPT